MVPARVCAPRQLRGPGLVEHGRRGNARNRSGANSTWIRHFSSSEARHGERTNGERRQTTVQLVLRLVRRLQGPPHGREDAGIGLLPSL